MTRVEKALEVRGWQVVTGLSVVSAVILGLTICTMGIFLAPLMTTFSSTSVQASQATTFFILAMTVTPPGLGWLIKRIGARTVMTGGALATALGYWLAAGSEAPAMFSLAMTLAGIGIGASTYVPSTIVIASWISWTSAAGVRR